MTSKNWLLKKCHHHPRSALVVGAFTETRHSSVDAPKSVGCGIDGSCYGLSQNCEHVPGGRLHAGHLRATGGGRAYCPSAPKPSPSLTSQAVGPTTPRDLCPCPLWRCCGDSVRGRGGASCAHLQGIVHTTTCVQRWFSVTAVGGRSISPSVRHVFVLNRYWTILSGKCCFSRQTT